MADDDKSTDQTVKSPKVEAEPVTPAHAAHEATEATEATPASPAVPTTPVGRPPVDRRSLGLGALAVGALVLAFVAGLAVGGHDDRGDRFERGRDGHGPFAQSGEGGDERGGFQRGGRGMQGGQMQGGGMQGDEMQGDGIQGGERPDGMLGGGPGERGGMGRGGHGGAGVVEAVSDDELTIAPLGGRIEELTVKLDDDTEVQARGDDGAGDIQDAAVSDISEGDIVMILGAPGEIEDGEDEDAATTATINAKAIVILRDGDE